MARLPPIVAPRHPRAARLCVIAALAAAGLVAVLAARAGDDPGRGQGATDAPRSSTTFVREPVFGSRMFVREAGDAGDPTVVLVHGLGAAGAHDWRHLIDELADDHHVIAPDLPGFGRSDVPESTLSPQRYAAVLRWLIERRELKPVRLVGHSMGGAVALYYASEHPGDVERLLVASVAGILHRAAFIRSLISPRPDLSGLPPGIRISVRRWLDAGERLVERLATGPDPTEYLREESPAWRRLLADRPNTNAALALMRTDFSGRLERIDLPVTIVWGGNDQVTPLRTARLLDSRLPRSRLEVIGAAAHVPMVSHPATFRRIVREALHGTVPGTPGPPREKRRDTHRCIDGLDQRVSGRYRRVVLESCVDVRLVDVEAEQIVIEDSLVEMTGVRISGPPAGAALEVRDSAVRATDVRIAGAPALHADGARMDLAGVSLRSPGAAVEVARGSGFIFSVSEMHSGLYTGYLHGMAEAAHGPLDTVARLRSANALPAAGDRHGPHPPAPRR